jgi:hypothetical protein
MKLTPGVNFINVLLKAFRRTDPKSIRIQSMSVIYMLLGSAHAKAAHGEIDTWGSISSTLYTKLLKMKIPKA